jgi:hypothetical protein
VKPPGRGAAALAFALLAAAPPAAGELALEGRLEQGGLVVGQAPPGVIAITLDGKPVPLAGDGRFLIGFDRDQPPTAMVEARAQDGRIIRRLLSIAPRSWRIEKIGVARRPSAATAEYLKRRETELGRSRPPVAPERGSRGGGSASSGLHEGGSTASSGPSESTVASRQPIIAGSTSPPVLALWS